VINSTKLAHCCYSFGLWLATKGHEAALLPLPLLGWEGEWEEKSKKLLGQDKDSLAEQQMK